MRKNLLLFFAVVVLFIFTIPFWFAFPKDLAFNQLFISQEILRHNPLDFETIVDQYRTIYGLGLNALFGPKIFNVDYTNPRDFFDYVFSRLPSYVLVYPTETYYYYKFIMSDGVTISGNLRLLDAEKGIIRFGYFNKNDPHNAVSDNWGGAIGKNEGLEIKAISPYVFDVMYMNKTVRFELSDFVHTVPKDLHLLSEEEFVSQIFDESGIRFILLFNNKTKTFYFVINEQIGINEDIIIKNDNFLIGSRTGYIYYFDKKFNRKILVGVKKNEIYDNSYYDGPFDQVPPRLFIKEKLIAAYPYVVYRGGIDEYGNFNQIEGSRVAISPYYDYDSFEALNKHFKPCLEETDQSLRWSCLTYEWKKDFHKTLQYSLILSSANFR